MMDLRIVGNAHDDRAAMDLCHEIIVDESLPMSERITGVKMLDKIMGEESDVDESDVHEYCADFV